MASPTSPSGADDPPVLPSIPLAPEAARSVGEQSIGGLVHEVTTQLSTLVRAEVELAKAEVTAEVRKGVTGSVFFAVAGAIGLFSLFYFFFALAELLSLWFLRWVAFGIVFVLMVLVAALFGFLGYRKVRKIRKPERTISTLKESAHVFSQIGRASANGSGSPRELRNGGVTAR